MEALEWRNPASKRFREDMECNAGVKMLSFSSPDLAISIRTSSSAGNQTPLNKREFDWAKAANRIVDEVCVWFFDILWHAFLSYCSVIYLQQIDAECEESLVARSRRRLASTTQLMQQIFPPLSSRSLSADAIALHESIVYMSAMLVLTDAWSSSCFLVGTSFSNSIENYSRRLKVLESEFLRFETGYSALDIRMECHELEKNAMIIRFTRFHECEETERAGWLIETANSEVFQNLFHPAGSEVLPQKLIADCGMLMKLLKGLHILSL